ncbi:sushi domain-containing protein 4 isoform X3 [Heterocephalus glaber]|uniref:Sushi domain-containing protein 4 isoform X3 n=1 Tax=Heterocephalus glaber TaxID=10181 RepID=A0AAX6RXW7_HETGA|nr:sushi domain-containing protein 4 isoform X3 [Heterocephalus glaber]
MNPEIFALRYIPSPFYVFILRQGLTKSVAQAGPELAILRLSFLSAGITSVHHQAWLKADVLGTHCSLHMQSVSPGYSCGSTGSCSLQWNDLKCLRPPGSQWTPYPAGCLRPLASSNGYVNISEFQTSFPVGTVIAYRCFPGFKLEGSEFLECLHSLIWSSSPPRCLALEVCPLPPTVSHGDFICHPRPCEHYNHGTVVEFYCDPGYSLTSDYKYITCQYGEWFPSYQVYCLQSEHTWPGTHETLLTTWKIVAFTATSVLLVLLLVILARMFQTKFKASFPPRGPPRSSSSDPDFVVVDGVPVLLPSYDEAVSGGASALGPGLLAAVGRGCLVPVDDQSPPAYPGDEDMGTGASWETCSSASGSSELLQSLYPPPPSQTRACPTPEDPDPVASTLDVASTSPGIDIADEIPLMEEGP